MYSKSVAIEWHSYCVQFIGKLVTPKSGSQLSVEQSLHCLSVWSTLGVGGGVRGGLTPSNDLGGYINPKLKAQNMISTPKMTKFLLSTPHFHFDSQKKKVLPTAGPTLLLIQKNVCQRLSCKAHGSGRWRIATKIQPKSSSYNSEVGNQWPEQYLCGPPGPQEENINMDEYHVYLC